RLDGGNRARTARLAADRRRRVDRRPALSPAQRLALAVNRQAAARTTTSTGMKAANTQKLAARAAAGETPSARPARLAAIPVAAAPTAKPIRCTVPGAAAARVASAASAQRTVRCTIAGQHRPIP